MDFPDQCMIEPLLVKDVYGECVYSPPTAVRCNYQEIQEIDTSGSNITSFAKLFLPLGSIIAMDSRITLAGGAQPYVSEIRHVKSQVSNRVVFIRVIIGVPGSRGGL